MSVIFATKQPKQLSTAAATLTAYYFDVSEPEGAAAHAEMSANLKAAGVECWTDRMPESYNQHHNEYWAKIDALVNRPKATIATRPLVTPRGMWSAGVTVDLEYVFYNQMNTIKEGADNGLRLFDWKELICPNRNIKQGYFVMSPELQRARQTTCKCGYCGTQYENGEPGQFCGACLDSQYIKIDDLNLLRLARVADDNKERPKLSAAELAEIMPIFEEVRTRGITERGIARRAKQRADVAKEYEKAIRVATVERDGKTWLLDNGIDTSLAIYYPHTDKWCFGWNGGIASGAELDRLRGKLAGFPFAYEIKSN